MKKQKDFLLVYNPHFIAQGSTIYNLEKPDLLLLGCDSDQSYKMINKFYKNIYNKKIVRKTQLREGEIAKISINSYITSILEIYTCFNINIVRQNNILRNPLK